MVYAGMFAVTMMGGEPLSICAAAAATLNSLAQDIKSRIFEDRQNKAKDYLLDAAYGYTDAASGMKLFLSAYRDALNVKPRCDLTTISSLENTLIKYQKFIFDHLSPDDVPPLSRIIEEARSIMDQSVSFFAGSKSLILSRSEQLGRNLDQFEAELDRRGISGTVSPAIPFGTPSLT